MILLEKKKGKTEKYIERIIRSLVLVMFTNSINILTYNERLQTFDR